MDCVHQSGPETAAEPRDEIAGPGTLADLVRRPVHVHIRWIVSPAVDFIDIYMVAILNPFRLARRFLLWFRLIHDELEFLADEVVARPQCFRTRNVCDAAPVPVKETKREDRFRRYLVQAYRVWDMLTKDDATALFRECRHPRRYFPWKRADVAPVADVMLFTAHQFRNDVLGIAITLVYWDEFEGAHCLWLLLTAVCTIPQVSQ